MRKLAGDIRSSFEDDARRLTEAFLTGEIALADGSGLVDVGLSEADVHRVAGEVLRVALEKRLLAFYMAALGSMKWLTLAEAEAYSRMGRTLLKEKIEDSNCRIYGTRQGDGRKSGIIVDRESIDAHYNKDREDFIAEIIDQVRKEGRHG
jgi:hypothetical protein